VVGEGREVTFIVGVAFLHQGARVGIDAAMLAKVGRGRRSRRANNP
jgi:hypothetical protein